MTAILAFVGGALLHAVVGVIATTEAVPLVIGVVAAAGVPVGVLWLPTLVPRLVAEAGGNAIRFQRPAGLKRLMLPVASRSA